MLLKNRLSGFLFGKNLIICLFLFTYIMVELGIGKFSMLTDEAALVNRLTVKSLIIFSDRK